MDPPPPGPLPLVPPARQTRQRRRDRPGQIAKCGCRTSFEIGYLVAGASLGAAAGALVAGPLTDHFGRKSLLIADAAIYAVGAILSALAVNTIMLLGARTLIGLAVGADSAIATAYIAEFAHRTRRSQLS